MNTPHPLLVLVAATTVAVTLAQCTAAPPPPSATPTTATTTPTTTTSATTTPATTTPSTAAATVHPVTAAELGASWRPGCPVGPDLLRRIELDYLGFDDRTHRGALIVHENLTAEVIAVFEQLYRMRYPIERISTVERYPGAEDELSMEDNNTSAFNCRPLPASDRWSQHAYGRAIDLNPLLNPYIDSTGAFEPRNAAAYLDRSRRDPGLLHDGDPAVRAFTDRGWRWGGHWRSPIDYQHFEWR